MLSMDALQEAADTIGWVWYLLVVLVVLGAIMWWIYQKSKAQQKKTEKQVVSEAKEPLKDKTSEDDLTKIEGIGPKVEKVLKEAGIANFEALSEASSDVVQKVLNDAGLQMMKPDGWIEQAHYAAEDDWDGLEKLQDELKGGRRL